VAKSATKQDDANRGLRAYLARMAASHPDPLVRQRAEAVIARNEGGSRHES
jgi:hypothetical protein